MLIEESKVPLDFKFPNNIKGTNTKQFVRHRNRIYIFSIEKNKYIKKRLMNSREFSVCIWVRNCEYISVDSDNNYIYLYICVNKNKALITIDKDKKISVKNIKSNIGKGVVRFFCGNIYIFNIIRNKLYYCSDKDGFTDIKQVSSTSYNNIAQIGLLDDKSLGITLKNQKGNFSYLILRKGG